MAGDDLKTKVRRRRRRKFYQRRRFVVGAVLLLLLLLLAANAYIILVRSSSRMKVKYLQNGLRAYELGNYDRARLNFERYLKEDPRRASMWYMLGLSHLKLGRGREGVEALNEATRLQPLYAQAHSALSQHYRGLGKPILAMRAAERGVAVEPAPVEAWVALGEARLMLGEVEGAIDAFRRAVQLDAALLDIQLKLADLYFSRETLGLQDVSAGLAMNRYEQAAIQAEELIFADSKNVRARIWLAKARAGQGLLGEAVKELERAVVSEPRDAGHRLLLASLQNAAKDYEGEVKTLTEAWEKTPDPEISIRLSYALTDRIGQPEAGKRALELGLERFPESASLHIAMIAHLTRTGDRSGARKVLDQAITSFPGNSLVLETSADLALTEGDREKALAALRASVDTGELNLGARRKLISLLADDYLKKAENGDPAKAARTEIDAQLAFFLDDEIGVNRGDLLACGIQARLYMVDGRFEDAARLLSPDGEGKHLSYEDLRILGLAHLRTPNGQRSAADAFLAALRHPSCPHTFEDYDLAYTTTFRVGTRISREVETARAAVQKWPRDADWRIRLSTSLYRERKFSEAAAECDRVKPFLTGLRDVRPWLLAARIYQAQGEITLARNELEEAVLIRRDAETRGALYSFLAATGDEKLGEEGFRTLLDENPTDPKAFLAFGDFLLKRAGKAGLGPEGDRELKQEALEHYQSALSLDPVSRDALRRVAELRMAQASNKEEAVAVAEEVVARMAELDQADPHALYFQGKLHLLKAEFEDARTALLQYVQSSANDPSGHYYLAIAHRRCGDLDQARDSFLTALGIDPAMVEAKLELASLYFTKGIQAHWHGELEDARSSFGKVLEIDPNEPETHRFLAETLAGLGLLDVAAVHAEKVLDEIPDDPGALFLSGLFRARRGDLIVAQERFEKLVSVAPDNPRSHMYLGMLIAEQGRPDAAIESLRRAYELDPDQDEVLRTIAITEVSAGRSAEALAFVEAERERTPRRSFVHQLLGDLYLSAGRAEDSIDSLQRAFELDPSNSAALAMSTIAKARLGRTEEAIEVLRSGMIAAGFPAGLFLLEGRMHLKLGARDEAELAFREALRRDAGTLDAYAELGSLLADDGLEDEAGRMFEEAVKRGTRNPVVYSRLATLAELRGEEDEAIGHYRQALQLIPDDPAILNNLAMLLAGRPDDIAEAVKAATRARKLKPKDPYVADTLGFVLMKADRLKEAVPLLLEAANALPDNAEAQHHAGMACYRNYEWKRARRLLKRALLLAPRAATAGEAAEALEKIR